MASTINASTTLGLISTADTSGVLQLQTANTTAVTVNANQTVSLAVGTANGVTYLNGSKVLTSGSALTFDGTRLGIGTASPDSLGLLTTEVNGNSLNISRTASTTGRAGWFSQNTAETIRLFSEVYGASATNTGFGLTLAGYGVIQMQGTASNGLIIGTGTNDPLIFGQNDTEGMRLTSTGLGIGTSSPASKFQVTSANGAVTLDSGTGESHYIDITHKGSYSDLGGIRFNQGSTTYGNNQILFRAMDSGGTVQTVMTLNGAGNLGLGVTPSTWSQGKAFEISAVGEGLWGNGLGDIWMLNGAYFNGGFKYSGTTKATAYRQGAGTSDGSHSWHIAGSGTAGNAISFTQAMTLDADGDLGIGTTSPSSYAGKTFQVNSSSTSVGIKLTNSATGEGNSAGFDFELSSSDINYVNRTASGNQKFWTNSTERARIDSSGRLLLGQTGAGFSNSNSMAFQPPEGYAVMNHANGTGSGTNYFWFGYNAGSIGTISQNGTTAVSYNTTSDYRLKNSVTPMTGALAKVAQLKPVTYKWNADGSDGEGFIAHELAEVVPQCVTGEKDAVDENGNPKYQGIDTSFLVATLTAALQELNAKFEAYVASHP